jgi:hypothetical protein
MKQVYPIRQQSLINGLKKEDNQALSKNNDKERERPYLDV